MSINLYRKGINSINRFISQNFAKNNFKIDLDRPIISFTFDDFPKTAAQKGLDLLTKYGLKATYYISFGLIDKDTATGRICSIKDVESVIKSGNDIGCHTFNHLGAYEQSFSAFENSIKENQRFVQDAFPQLKFSVFSYPKGQVKPQTKKIVQRYFKCSRGIIPGINKGKIDLNLLKSTRIYGHKANFEWSKKFIHQNVKENGWLIFYTHDVSPEPTPYGCTPNLFEKVLNYSRESGAIILTVEEAYNTVTRSLSV